jgi:hypothetical protein
VFFTLLAAILFVITLATPSVIHTRLSVGSIDVLDVDFGPFRICYHAGDDSSCKDIDNHCEYQIKNPIKDINMKVVEDCDELNSARDSWSSQVRLQTRAQTRQRAR